VAEERETLPNLAELRFIADDTRAALSDAREAILRKDPLSAAQVHARRAAVMLQRNSIAYGSVLGEASSSSAALRRAWNVAVRRAAVARAARVPALAALIWRDARAEGTETSVQESAQEPAGYEDAVAAYRDAIRKLHRDQSEK
jgi:hypothetical protein